jgi:DNA mismatch repair protein MutS
MLMHYQYLKEIQDELCSINPFSNSISKFNELGYLLKCYHEIFANDKYEKALKYSVGFEGYVDNLLGLHNNLILGNVSFATFSTEKSVCNFKKQYYPPLINQSPVKNNCSFEKNMIISSPNKSGKTTILKTTTINIIFSQQVGAGFFETAEIMPYTHIHSYLNIPDTSGRDSLFQAESRRCKEIIDIIIKDNNPLKYRHFCIFDELYSGTNPQEASQSGYAFLKYLSSFNNVNFILTTHYFSICKKFIKSSGIQNYKMVVNVLDNGEFEYTYKIKKGISKMKGGVRVLKDMDYPSEIINTIENNSKSSKKQI